MASRKTVRSARVRVDASRKYREDSYAILDEIQFRALKVARDSLASENNASGQYYVDMAAGVEALRELMTRNDRE